MMQDREQVLSMLQEVRPDVDFDTETSLIDSGILDSFDIVTFVGELSEMFDVEISVDDLIPENFNSAQAMLELVTRLQEEA